MAAGALDDAFQALCSLVGTEAPGQVFRVDRRNASTERLPRLAEVFLATDSGLRHRRGKGSPRGARDCCGNGWLGLGE